MEVVSASNTDPNDEPGPHSDVKESTVNVDPTLSLNPEVVTHSVMSSLSNLHLSR